MVREVLEFLNLRPGDTALDATLGAGGHTEPMISKIAPAGRLAAFEVDPEALEEARPRLEAAARDFGVRLTLIRANFRQLEAALAPHGLAGSFQGILADLGVSSMQLDRPERGFSFRADAPLDLRMDPDLPRDGAGLLEEVSEEELADLLYHLGGERGGRRIARAVRWAREQGQPVRSTGQLEHLVRRALGVRRHQRIHPATRTFQALRIAVNDELGALTAFLEQAPHALAPGGTLVILSFHSGEDRLVKNRFKELASSGSFHVLTRSPLRPSADEVQTNRRGRSARLRALRRES